MLRVIEADANDLARVWKRWQESHGVASDRLSLLQGCGGRGQIGLIGHEMIEISGITGLVSEQPAESVARVHGQAVAAVTGVHCKAHGCISSLGEHRGCSSRRCGSCSSVAFLPVTSMQDDPAFGRPGSARRQSVRPLEESIVQANRNDYFTAYRNLKLTRDAQGVLVVQLHDDGRPLTFTAEAHTDVVDAFYRISQDRANKIVILTGAGGDFMLGVDWPSFKDVSDPGVWSQVHDEGVQA